VLRVIICSAEDLSPELAQTFVGRAGVDRFKAASVEEVRTLARAVSPQLILVDRDLPDAQRLITRLREEPATQHRSLAVLARGFFQPVEVELLDAGANAILRLPPDAGWDDRLQRLLRVASRQEVRLPIRVWVDTTVVRTAAGDSKALSVNVSANGILLETALPLQLGQHLSLAFELEGGTRVAARGRVVRDAGGGRFGVDFVDLDETSRDAIRWLVRSTQLG
jgi:DNA-binding response OmpR family regulator